MDVGFLVLSETSGRAFGRDRPDPPSVRMRRHAARDRVFTAGDPVDRVYELVGGAVLIVAYLSRGRRQILDVVGPGRLFGLTGATHHRTTAHVASASTVYGLDLATARRNPRVAERLAHEALDEIDRLRDLAARLGRATALERVADFLVRAGGDTPTEGRIHLPVSRGELADHLGLTSETVCRSLAILRRRGVIGAAGGADLRVVDPMRLIELAGR